MVSFCFKKINGARKYFVALLLHCHIKLYFLNIYFIFLAKSGFLCYNRIINSKKEKGNRYVGKSR